MWPSKSLWTLALSSACALGAQANDTHTNAAPAWTSASWQQALRTMPKGDVARGQALHQSQFCASCHGAQGVAPTHNWPHVAGQSAAYTYKLMLDYQAGRMGKGQHAGLMQDAAQALSPQDMADVAAYYASLPAPAEGLTQRPQANPVLATQLVKKGDTARLITPCASCHGTAGQGGQKGAPALAGQNPRYFVQTMLAYQSGARQNDPDHGMRQFAQPLNRAEIEALAAYYADMAPK